jgi:hypothetical protein
LRGGIVPVRSLLERSLLTKYDKSGLVEMTKFEERGDAPKIQEKKRKKRPHQLLKKRCVTD